MRFTVTDVNLTG